MPGLLFPAYQKFYSAISCLERFDKEKNFFDNISSLDNFFSEYRNITFAIQAALKHTTYNSLYEVNRDKYLTDHWFVDKRNETTKQQPFQLIKNISVTIYNPDSSISLRTFSFSVEDDVPMESMQNNLKEIFIKMSRSEVFFSAAFSFFEKGTQVELWDKVISGIVSMQDFMDAMYKEINEDCPLCNQLKNKIRLSKYSAPRDFWLINDYVYYPQQDEFERAARLAMFFSQNGKNVAYKHPLAELTNATVFNFDGTAFGTFVLMHAFIRTITPNADIMPAILIIYTDNTYTLDVFHSDIKTTTYRKIDEVAQCIKEDDILQICFMSLYSFIPLSDIIAHTSKERLAASSRDILVFASIDENLVEQEYVFDGDKLSKTEYVANTTKYGCKNSLVVSKLNMSPILQAFKEKKNRCT